ncbi:MAG: lysophospholipid acyltransferase family protein [Elusimicrobia bacterium]|nr:lysophospholipid acyltransferase family protein [Elusimicrobiota bacterium]
MRAGDERNICARRFKLDRARQGLRQTRPFEGRLRRIQRSAGGSLNFLAAAALSALGLIVTPLPRRFELWLGPKLGWLLLRVAPKRRRIAYDNIRRCFPEYGPGECDTLLRDNFEHYGMLALEMLHMFSPIHGHYRRYAESLTVIEGLEHWRAAHAKGKGTILVTGHFANWETSGIIGAHGLPMLMATRQLKPQWVHDKIIASRHSLDSQTVFGKRILPTMIKQLKEGKMVGLMLDQYAPPPMGVPATFFGVTVATQAVVGLLVQRTGAAIVPACQRREKDGKIHLVFEPEIILTPEELEHPSESATALAARIEEFIRATPAQWLWVHRRFKNVVWPEPVAG